MPYRYVPMLRSKVGEVDALDQLIPQAKQRIFPIFHVVSAPPATFVQKIAQAWAQPIALDGLFNFGETGAVTDFVSLASNLRLAGLTVIPSVACEADQRYITAANRFIGARQPRVVVKVTFRQLQTLQAWINTQGWQPNNIDLIIHAGHVAGYDTTEFSGYALHAIQNNLPNKAWRSVTLAGSSAPKDMSALQVGRNLVPRLDWALWQNIHGHVNFQLDYGDYGISHPDLTEPPGAAMARATVSVRYAVDNDWIVIKGRSTSGVSGQPMHTQYWNHAKALHREAQFGGVVGCWADTRIAQIAAQATSARSGSRPKWVEIGVNRHLSLVTDRLP